MGYYVRIFSPSERVPSVTSLQAALDQENLAGTIKLEVGTDEDWSQILLSHANGPEIAIIERNDSSSNSLVTGEIEEFLEDIADCKPANAAAWLADYLPKTKAIYAFQLLGGTDVKNGWNILGEAKNAIHAYAEGILQADGEGFSDEDGYHILWQFSESVKGTWWMGVLQEGKWVHFQMNLGNKKHREAFFRGEIPKGAKLAE